MDPREIIERQPVGTLVVDRDGVVRFANPAAGQLLGVGARRLIGEAFGLPVLPGDGLTDVNVPGRRGLVRTLAMRATELPGDGHLITLFDVSGRVRRYEHEHRLVEALQRSLLLDQMPAVPGISLAARYLPGDDDIRVGGDWFDAIPLNGDRLGLAIGDVTGHGVGSVALMSQLRNAMRALALEHDSPALVLDRMDELLARLEPEGMASAICLTYDPGPRQLTYAAAGHPYPLLVRPEASNEFLTGARSPLLGATTSVPRENERVALPPGSTLVLYTDGLIERRGEPIDDRLAELAAAAAGSETDDLETVCDTLLTSLLGVETSTDDDVAVLIMRTSGPPAGRDPRLDTDAP